jgi:outer membrane protein assembly factor BamD
MTRILISFLLLALAACAQSNPAKIKEDQTLYTQGMKYFERERYLSAIDFFSQLKNRFPESPLVKQARLRLADSYFEAGEYIDAEIEYHQFTTLYPLHSEIQYAWLSLGKAQLKQAPRSAQKDLQQVLTAKRTFQTLAVKWPASPEAEQARTYIQQCLEKEIEKQLYLANYYQRVDKYDVSLHHLNNIDPNAIVNEDQRERFQALMAQAKQQTQNP